MKKIFILGAIALTGIALCSSNVSALSNGYDSHAKENPAETDPNYGYHPYGDDSVLRPQMGFSTWNNYREKIDENKLTQAAQTMIDLNLNDHQYRYFNIDDCWQTQTRDAEGRMQWNAVKFPSEDDFVDKLKALDSENPLKVGLYSSTGHLTCEDLMGSGGHEYVDAQTFAEWGIDFLKYDYCHVQDGNPTPGWEYNQYAPNIDYIQVSKPGQSSEAPRLEAEDESITKREGEAQIVNGGTNKVVNNLSQNKGSLTYTNVYVEKAGTYNLLVGFQKGQSSQKKRLDVMINGNDWYEMEITDTSGWSPTATHVIPVQLEAGNNTIKLYNDVHDQASDSIRRYSKMGRALQEATYQYAIENSVEETPIFYNICEHGRSRPWEWATGIGNSWRTGHDITNTWDSIVSKYNETVNLWSYQTPGSYNDPDMMQVGNVSNMTIEQEKSHFTLWAVMNSPMMLGMDIRKFADPSNPTQVKPDMQELYDVITNDRIISLNQEYLLQAKRVSQSNSVDTLIKPMKDGEFTIVFFNNSNSPKTASYNMANLPTDDKRVHIDLNQKYVVSDLWEAEGNADVVYSNKIDSGNIPAYGVKVLHVKNFEEGDFEKGVNIQLDGLPTAVGAGETVSGNIVVNNVGSKDTVTVNNISALVKKDSTDITSEFEITLGEIPTEPIDALGKVEIPFTIKMRDKVDSTNQNAAFDNITFEFTTNLKFSSDETATEKKNVTSVQLCQAQDNYDTIYVGDAKWIGMSNSENGKNPVRNQKYNGSSGQKITLGGQQFDKGFGLNASGHVSLYIGGGTYRLTGRAGIDDNHGWKESGEWGGPTTIPDMKVIIEVDGVVVYESKMLKPQNENDHAENSTWIDFSKMDNNQGLLITGHVLTIRFDDCGKNNYDHASFGDALLTKVTAEKK